MGPGSILLKQSFTRYYADSHGGPRATAKTNERIQKFCSGQYARSDHCICAPCASFNATVIMSFQMAIIDRLKQTDDEDARLGLSNIVMVEFLE